MASSIINSAINKGNGVFFVAHRIEIVTQTVLTLDRCGIECGVIAAGFTPARGYLVQVAMVGSLGSRAKFYESPKIIIIDEAHHATAATYRKMLDMFPDAIIIGLTATPERLDGKGLGDVFTALIPGPKVRWLIGNNFLSDYVAYCPPTVEQNDFHVRAGEFVQAEVLKSVDKPSVTGDAISHYIKHSEGKRCIVFAASVGHSMAVADAYQARGIPAAHVDGDTDRHIRKQAMQDFADGKLMVLTNCNLFSEGVDVPAVNTVQMLRPTASLGMYMQQVGRALRYMPGKTALVLDHVGNIHRHGLPCADREWRLEGRENRRKKMEDLSIKICPQCYMPNAATAKTCSNCGHQWVVAKAREIAEVDGELQQVRMPTITEINEMMDKASTLKEWHAVAKAMGKSSGWAYWQFTSRKKPRMEYKYG